MLKSQPGINRPVLRYIRSGLIGTVLIGVVAAILFPIFAQAKLSGKQPCLSNLKMMWIASNMYANDFDDRFPLADSWMDGLKTYSNSSNSESLFHDKSAAGDPTYGYAFRERALFGPISAIKNPSKFILIFDSVLDGRNRHSELWSLPQKGRHPKYAPVTRRDFGIYADGHLMQASIWPAMPGRNVLPQIEQVLLEDDASQQDPGKSPETAHKSAL